MDYVSTANRQASIPERISIARKEFDDSVKLIFSDKNSEGYSLLSFVKRTLAQFNLEVFYTLEDVLLDAYSRGICLINKGRTINNPPAWLRVTAYNIIREYSRKESRYRIRIEADSIGTQSAEPLFSEEMLDLHLKAIWYAFTTIKKEDRELLELRIINGMSWKEIRLELADNNSEPKSIGALRTSFSRALQRLRKKYHETTEMI